MFNIKTFFIRLFGKRTIPVTIVMKHEKSCFNTRCTMWSLKADIEDDDNLEIVWQRKQKPENIWYDVAEDVNPYIFRTFNHVSELFKIRCKIKGRGFTKKTVEVVIKSI